MSRIRKYIQKAFDEGLAIGAFNIANLETLKAVASAAKKLNSPAIVELSPGELQFMGMKQATALVRAFEDEFNIPLFMNLDHGTDPQIVKNAVDCGFDYVHFDASSYSFEEGIRLARDLSNYAHSKDILIESEFDHIEGSSADHTKEDVSNLQDSTLYTDPKKAQSFINETKIDVFAGFYGNLHGIYSTQKHLDFDVIKELRSLNPGVYLSLHGGSGIFEDNVKEALKYGFVKVNVNSEMRIAYKLTLQEVLNSTNEIAIYKLMEKPIDAIQKIVEAKIKLFGSFDKI